MLVAAAVCPSPPLLVPEVAAGAAEELADTRAACVDAVGVLAAARPDLLVAVGPVTDNEWAGAYPEGSSGSLRGYGVPLTVTLGEGSVAGRPLPPSLTVAAWLLERTSWSAAPVAGQGVPERSSSADCLRLGRQLATDAERVALLVLGDGSATRSLKAPGYFDERAEGFDAGLARALGAADSAALRALDPVLAAELQVSGRSSSQVLAGAAESADLAGELLHDSAPYGVGYLVATWS